MSITSELKGVEDSIKKAVEQQSLSEALERLYLNKDFKEVVLKAYFEKEPIRLVFLKGDPDMQSFERKESIDNQMNSISHLFQFFSMITNAGNMAAKDIEINEDTRNDLITGAI